MKKCCDVVYSETDTECLICGKALSDIQGAEIHTIEDILPDTAVDNADQGQNSETEVLTDEVVDVYNVADNGDYIDEELEEQMSDSSELKMHKITSIIAIIFALLALIGAFVSAYFVILAPSYDKGNGASDVTFPRVVDDESELFITDEEIQYDTASFSDASSTDSEGTEEGAE